MVILWVKPFSIPMRVDVGYRRLTLAPRMNLITWNGNRTTNGWIIYVRFAYCR